MLSEDALAQRLLRESRERGATANLTGEMVGVEAFFDTMGCRTA